MRDRAHADYAASVTQRRILVENVVEADRERHCIVSPTRIVAGPEVGEVNRFQLAATVQRHFVGPTD